MKLFKKISREQFWDYLILTARFVLAWFFLYYGQGKLTGGQFGLTEEELLTPIKDLSLFKLGWYLFDFQPFRAFIGISQVICAILLLWNRTVILGAFLYFPIALNILIIDLTIMPIGPKVGFTFRLSFYLLLNILILWHYREKLLIMWKAAWEGVSTKFKYPAWVYLTLPVAGVFLSLFQLVPQLLFLLISDPEQTVNGISKTFQLVIGLFI